MSRFSNTSNRNLFMKKKSKSVNILPIEEPIIELPIIEEQPVIIPEPIIIQEELSVISVDEVISLEDIIVEIVEPEIKLEEIYQNNQVIEEEIKPVENPQQIELKKRRSKERFKLLVDEIMLNKRKESINGWNI